MQSVNECYKKVKKDCIKYIKSQESSKEKFKNKERMGNSLIPISLWISGKANKKKTIYSWPSRWSRNRKINNCFNYYNYFKKIF